MIPNDGSLGEITPIKLMLAMDEQNQTGILYFRKNEVLKVFYLNQGKISWAISSDEEDKIEHILLAQKLVNPDALAPYLAGNKISESFGKILVENGLISLETLINASREQLKRIATSVMFWNSGNYQLEPESPPTRLVSLELDIVPLVYNYILAHMDVNIIWEELGSLSGELRQVPVPEKIFQYNLDSEQQEVFAYFHEPQRPENVLLRFAAERKHTILKILYFLLITGLLVRKEADTIPPLDFNELDSLFGQAQSDATAEVNVDIPAVINEADIKDIPQLDLPDIHESRSNTEVSLPKLTDLTPNNLTESKTRSKEVPSAPKQAKAPTRPQPLLPEKQKSRWLSISFLSILLTVVVIALFIWFSRTPEISSPQTAAQRPAAQSKRKTQQQQPPQQVPAPAVQILQSENPATTPKSTEMEPQKEPAAEKEKVIPAPSSASRDSNARQAFASGRFNAAGNLWRQEIITEKIGFSILLEMDCLEQSVNYAYQQLTDQENFFILNRVKKGRGCWLVLWGKFRTRNEAEENMSLVPEFFMKQNNPPVVIELEPYL
ncbi:MAG: hypothetical protein JXI33_09130 [Candidatus Aminicenantes bacterium]|nr:hypothetical protein [Candidatus Aminicenantes bacterium]